MHHAFRNTTPSMRILFEGGQDDEPVVESSDEGEEGPVSGRKRKAGDDGENLEPRKSLPKRKVCF